MRTCSHAVWLVLASHVQYASLLNSTFEWSASESLFFDLAFNCTAFVDDTPTTGIVKSCIWVAALRYLFIYTFIYAFIYLPIFLAGTRAKALVI